MAEPTPLERLTSASARVAATVDRVAEVMSSPEVGALSLDEMAMVGQAEELLRRVGRALEGRRLEAYEAAQVDAERARRRGC